MNTLAARLPHRQVIIGIYALAALLVAGAVLVSNAVAYFPPGSLCWDALSGYNQCDQCEFGSVVNGDGCTDGVVIYPCGYCADPPPSCAGWGYDGGVWPDCYNDACPADPGIQRTAAECSATCTPDASCAANTCSDSTCTATAADCSTYPVPGTRDCAPPPTCGNGSPGPYPSCPLPSCADYGQLGTYPFCYDPPPTCGNGSPGPYPSCPLPPPPDTCDTNPTMPGCPCPAGYTGTYPSCVPSDPGGGAPSPSVSCSASPSMIAPGNSTTWVATPADGAGPAYSWYDAVSNALLGTGSSFAKSYPSPGIYAVYVRANDGAGGTVQSPNCQVTVAGICNNSGPVTLSALPNRVQPNVQTNVTFTLRAENVSGGNCTLSGPGITAQTYVPASCTASGSYTASLTLSQQATYTLSCPGGQAARAIVNVVGTVKEH